MATLMCCNPPNWDAFSLLLANPATDRNLLTPATKSHTLHIAVVLLPRSILKRLLDSGLSLSEVAPTALGHTLLHLACLPLDITHVNISKESISNSAHEFRQISPLRMQKYIVEADHALPQPIDFFAAQTEVVHYLLSQSPDLDALLAAQNCHGNTAFHYIAMHRTVNHDLLGSLPAVSEKAEDVYYDARNGWDWSGENLVRHGEVADMDVSKKFGITSHAARVIDGEAVVPYR